MKRRRPKTPTECEALTGNCQGDPIRAPYSLQVPSPEKANRYGTAPIEDVPIEDTAFAAALPRVAESDPLGVANFVSHRENILRPRVREAKKAYEDAGYWVRRRNERAKQANTPSQKRIEKLDALTDDLLAKRLAEVAKISSARADAMLKCAEKHANVKLVFDPEKPVPDVLNAALRTSIESHAARGKLPFNPKESGLFLEPVMEWAGCAFVGSIEGLSLGAAAGSIHLSALDRQPVVAIGACLCGFGVTLFSGRTVKALWRTASESYYLCQGWIGQSLVALVTTVGFVAVATIVDLRGLMALAGLHEQVGDLAQKATAPPTQSIAGTSTLILLGAFVSSAYYAYNSISGWRKDRAAATNRISESQEKERVALVQDVREPAAWTEALAAGNAVVAIDANAKNAETTYEVVLSHVAKRDQVLRANLVQLTEAVTASEAALIQRAITEASGQQIESNNLLRELRESYAYSVRRNGRPPRRPYSFWDKLRRLFGSRSQIVGGA